MSETASFIFAGIQFPRYVPGLVPSPRCRLQRWPTKHMTLVHTYYTAPEPNAKGCGFYLDEDRFFSLRWTWCDEVASRIGHTGWFTADDDGAADKMRGIVVRLPHGRGFLAGWSMGEHMSSFIEYDIIADEREAAHRADRMAELAAERERDYQREQDHNEDFIGLDSDA